jgi:hypothetical protein
MTIWSTLLKKAQKKLSSFMGIASPKSVKQKSTPPIPLDTEIDMPFVSEKQKRYLYAKKPKVAKEFAAHTPKDKKLPKRVKKKK